MEVTIEVKVIKNYKLKSAQLDQSFPLLFSGRSLQEKKGGHEGRALNYKFFPLASGRSCPRRGHASKFGVRHK
jgi:hypothetical protein